MRATVFGLAGALLFGLSAPLPAQEVDQLRDANRAASVLALERLKARDPDAWRLLRRCPPRAILLHDYAGRGYAHPTDEGRAARKQLREGWGLHLDDTYTAKTLAGLIDFVERNQLAAKNHLFIHTYDPGQPRP